LTDADDLRPFATLKSLSLTRPGLGPAYWNEIAAVHPRLTRLFLREVPGIDDLTGVAHLPLEYLTLSGCPHVTDLSPLASLGDLAILALQGAVDDLDLGPLAGLRDLTIRLYEGQRVRGLERLHPTTTIKWELRSAVDE
jgi:hypothetical protein